MNVQASAANLLWAGACLDGWRRFRAALAEPTVVQRELLKGCLQENRGTELGRRYDFTRILASADVVAAYQERVPIVGYDDLEPYIERIAAGEQNVLTQAPVRRLAPSSGSTSAAKLVPHTAQLQREFSRAVDPWIVDLYLRHRALVGGPAYWSVTPARSFESVAAARFGAAATAVPIGFDEDSEYLGRLRRRLVDAALAVPALVRRVADPDAFRYVTLLYLLRERALRLMSIWHPSFLMQLLDTLPASFERIVSDVAHGTLTPPAPIDPEVRAALTHLLRPDPRRARELNALTATDARSLWPRLSVVSCWGDGAAGSYADRLARAIPGVHVQRKGLIATEAIVSLPFGGRHPLAIRSHFFEFVDAGGHPRLPHELGRQGDYSVVLTTGGGLYRYRLGDRVRVNGWIDATPSLEFVGRSDRVSDRFGEKLSDGFVATVIAELFARDAPPRFAMLAPEPTARGIAYTLLVEPDGPLRGELARSLERALRQNPHYAWCVDLGQLRPARVVRVGPHADRVYLEACVARGQRLGDVKPVSLHGESGWEGALGAGQP